MDEQTIAARLTELRKRNGFTQKELAQKINYSDKVISKWERGESLPDIMVLADLASLYNVSLDEMVSGIRTQSRVDQFDTKLVKVRRPSYLVVALFILIVLAEIIFVSVTRNPLIIAPSFIIYLSCILILGFEINHHEWMKTYQNHQIRVINKFLVAELWIDGKLVDKTNSIISIGVKLEGKVNGRSLKVSVFRLFSFTCDIVVE